MARTAITGHRRWATALPLAVSAVLVLAACQPLGEGGTGSPGATGTDGSGDGGGGGGGQLVIATGGTGGVYYPLGGGLANVISDNIEGYTATITETNASVDNMFLIQDGGADIAFALGDTAADAVNGTGADFEGNPIDACAIGRIYNNFTQLVSSTDAGVTSVADLEGKRVSLGSPGSGTEVIALRILEAAGIDPDADIERAQLGVDETVEALRDGTIDAGFWSGGLPTGALVEYATTGEMVLVPTGEYAAAMAEQYGEFYLEEPIPAGTYEGQDADVSSVVVPNVLVVNTSMDEALQTEITRVLFEHKDALVEVHPAAEALDPAVAQDVPFMDVCPGSQAYYDEAG
ncbi:MAG TPA: TAXI family TRAP transporter solute-binding subunit [candidate division Zixibacteria bacterium]|nr:TAXI family TRAP transporter solute-binding subunit [candidate division Zixibacteria bacterium]